MKKRYLILIIILVLIACFSMYYLNDYYHGDSESLKYLNNSGNVSVIKSTNGYLFDGPGNDTALIFYPGAKVEYVAYSPLMNRIAGGGVDAYRRNAF